jgi:hypothetical protein
MALFVVQREALGKRESSRRLRLGVKHFSLAALGRNQIVVVRVFFRPQLPQSRMKGVEGEKKCWGWPVL